MPTTTRLHRVLRATPERCYSDRDHAPGVANRALDAGAAAAGIGKDGLLYHFPTKGRLVETLVLRSTENWCGCYMGAYERTLERPNPLLPNAHEDTVHEP